MLEQFFYQAKEAVRHIAEWKVYPGWGGNNRTEVWKDLERLLAVVRRHTRVADTSKWEFLVGDMDNCVIDARATRWGVTDNIICTLLVAEVVEGEWLFALVDKFNSLLGGDVCDNRENRTENLLLHNGAIEAYIIYNCWLYVALILIVISAYNDICTLDITDKAVKSAIVDNAYKVATLFRVLAQKTLKLALQSLDKLFFNGVVDKQVVWSDAGLDRKSVV